MTIYEGKIDARGFRFAIVVSRFNSFITDRLLEGALDALRRNGAEEKDIEVYKTPGSFEIPLVAKLLAKRKDIDGIICLGAIIKGDTPHFHYVATEVAKGIAITSLESLKPIAFGIVTSETIEQAIERAGTKSGNKGYDAAITVIEMVNLLKEKGLCAEERLES
ncbi:MAG: 6,7-dimethyl-8-ribityllumazine synthase [Desulfobacterota bacterium]|nr:6,7-dimethyl-8-ribityllumazine synthase [Thermodesulfobacteriota bacterium]MDW8002499.1 6,7-dimethyl-8-ribityllumazine synthase [Deltaproteobacteria bacterium]